VWKYPDADARPDGKFCSSRQTVIFLHLPARTKERAIPAFIGLISFNEVLFPGDAFYIIFHHPGDTGGRLRSAAVPVVAVDAVSVFRFDKGPFFSYQLLKF